MNIKIIISIIVLVLFVSTGFVLFFACSDTPSDIDHSILLESDIIDGNAAGWLEKVKDIEGVNIAYNEIDNKYHYLLTFSDTKEIRLKEHLDIFINEKDNVVKIYIKTNRRKKTNNYKLLSHFYTNEKPENILVFLNGVEVNYNLSKVNINYFE